MGTSTFQQQQKTNKKPVQLHKALSRLTRSHQLFNNNKKQTKNQSSFTRPYLVLPGHINFSTTTKNKQKTSPASQGLISSYPVTSTFQQQQKTNKKTSPASQGLISSYPVTSTFQ